MIFGTLNPEKILYLNLTDLSTSPVRCSRFTLGNPKVIFNSIINTYFRLYPLAQKKTNSSCCIAALAVWLLLFSASWLHSLLCCVWGTLQEERVYWYGHVGACGNSLLQHGLNFSTAWCTIRLISVEKDCKHVSIQKVVTLNTCCDTACLTFQLPRITTGSFQSHWRRPRTVVCV